MWFSEFEKTLDSSARSFYTFNVDLREVVQMYFRQPSVVIILTVLVHFNFVYFGNLNGSYLKYCNGNSP